MKLLLRTGIGFFFVPERVPGERRGDERTREDECGEAGKDAEREHDARADLHRAVDPHELFGRRAYADRVCNLGGHLVGLRHLGFRAPQRVKAAVDEHRSEQGTSHGLQ